MKRLYLVGAVIVAAFTALGATSFTKALTPYTTFQEARHAEKTVQIMGTLETKAFTREPDGRFSFTLTEEGGDTMKVIYRGAKPTDMERAPSVGAIGRYENGIFVAQQLLVKCPSKYQGIEK
ncbi:MAG: cytochrome c maturation protein CcmE [Armatimonadetes bacterium]|nr:cytochrome c maturation protein CcmE [Armatimonadota bacterium]